MKNCFFFLVQIIVMKACISGTDFFLENKNSWLNILAICVSAIIVGFVFLLIHLNENFCGCKYETQSTNTNQSTINLLIQEKEDQSQYLKISLSILGILFVILLICIGLLITFKQRYNIFAKCKLLFWQTYNI